MKIYKITLGQLITMWILGVVLTHILSDAIIFNPEYKTLLLILFIMIPFSLIFYSIGWKKYNYKLPWFGSVHTPRFYKCWWFLIPIAIILFLINFLINQVIDFPDTRAGENIEAAFGWFYLLPVLLFISGLNDLFCRGKKDKSFKN